LAQSRLGVLELDKELGNVAEAYCQRGWTEPAFTDGSGGSRRKGSTG